METFQRRRLASPRSEQVSTFSTDGYNAEEEPQLTPNTRQARKVTSSRNQAGSIDSMLDQDSETKKHPLNEDDEEHKEDIKKTETFEEEETASAEQNQREHITEEQHKTEQILGRSKEAEEMLLQNLNQRIIYLSLR